MEMCETDTKAGKTELRNPILFHTVNAGLYVRSGDRGLLIDAFHNDGRAGFSSTPKAVLRQMTAHTGIFTCQNDLVFTHLHGDHFDSKLVRRVYSEYPGVRICAPGIDGGGAASAKLQDGVVWTDLGEIQLALIPSIHEGAEYVDQPHNMILVQAGTYHCLACGDALLDEKLAEKVNALFMGRINSVFVNPFQLIRPEGQAFLRCLSPDSTWMYHLPFPEDDVYLYRKIAQTAIQRLPKSVNAVEILEPMQFIPTKSCVHSITNAHMRNAQL